MIINNCTTSYCKINRRSGSDIGARIPADGFVAVRGAHRDPRRKQGPNDTRATSRRYLWRPVRSRTAQVIVYHKYTHPRLFLSIINKNKINSAPIHEVRDRTHHRPFLLNLIWFTM
jgi:hypothetical protein